MKRIITGLTLGLRLYVFFFLTSNFIFQLGYMAFLKISSIELLSKKKKK
ncbi:MAG: hypothetical protein CM15mP13_2760 [Pseudomonadota bacterium]|nr:MAG: hypothetical protein CM15mP13_2760 [Pseudomonadota bacterium]